MGNQRNRYSGFSKSNIASHRESGTWRWVLTELFLYVNYISIYDDDSNNKYNNN